MVPGIKPDLEHKETNIEVDLMHKETTQIDASNQPNSKISKVRSILSVSIIEDSGECMIEKIDDSHSNSTGIFQTKADYTKNMDLSVYPQVLGLHQWEAWGLFLRRESFG